MTSTPLHAGSLRSINDFPKVYISKITISNDSGIKIRQEARTAIVQKEPFDDVSLSKSIKIDLNMVCYLTYERVLEYTKFTPSTIRVVMNRNSQLYGEFSGNPSVALGNGGILYRQQRADVSIRDIRYDQFFRKKSYSDSGNLNEINSKQFKTDQIVEGQRFTKVRLANGMQVYEVPLEASFVIEQSDISHLSFFVFPIHQFDTKGSSVSQGSQLISMGPVTSELVYSSGEVVDKTFAFETQSGEYWTGPVHEHTRGNPSPSGYVGWMANSLGHMASSVPSPKLNQIVFENNKVIDKRMSDKIKSISYDINKEKKRLSSFRQSINDKTRNVGNEIELKTKKMISSDINFSIDSKGNTRFIFHLNIAEILKEVTEYPSFIGSLKVKNPSIYSQMLGPGLINKIRIFRQLIGQETDIQRETSAESDPRYSQEELIFESSGAELQTGQVAFRSLFNNASRATLGANQSTISVLKKINLNIPSSEEILTYTGIDFEIKQRQAGKYKYSLELSLEDPTKRYLNGAINQLSSIIEGTSTESSLNSYYDDSQKPEGFYDGRTQSFTGKFITHYRKNYYSGRKDYIEEMVKSYTSIISIFNTGSSYKLENPSSSLAFDEVYSIYKYLINISSPYSGTPQGILELISLIKETRDRLIKQRDLSHSIKKSREGSRELLSTPNLNSSSRELYTKHRHDFKNILNVDAMNQRKFYEFLMINKGDVESNQDGLLLLDRKYFTDRANLEASRLFGRNEGPLVVADSNEHVYNPGDSIEKNKFSFFSPSRVVLDESRSVEMFSRDGFNGNLKEINSALNEIITHNQASSISRGIESMVRNGLTYRYKKEKDYSSQIREDKNINPFKKSNSDTLYQDTPEVFSPRAETRAESSEMGGEELVDFVRRIDNSNFLESSNTVKFYNMNKRDGGESFKKIKKGEIRNEVQLRYQGEKASTSTQNLLLDAPNHLKSLMIDISSPQVNSRSPFNSEDMLEKDFLRDPNQQGFVYFNYKKLTRIEVLRGFARDGAAQSIQSPVWSIIRQQDLNSTKDTLLYCRMVEYENVDYGYSKDRNLSLPMRNKYFFIHTGDEDVNSIPNYSVYSESNQNSDLYQYKRTLEKLMLDYEDKRKKVFNNPKGCAKISFFETNMKAKKNQPIFFGANDSTVASNTSIFFSGKSYTEIREYLIMAGHEDIVKFSGTGIKGSPMGKSRGLQRTDPIGGASPTTARPQTQSRSRSSRMATRSSSTPTSSPRVTSGGSGGTY